MKENGLVTIFIIIFESCFKLHYITPAIQASWGLERTTIGSNENGNRMIQRRVPKGADFTGITEADTLEVRRWANEYPRGILGGRCAGRVLIELAKETGVEGVELIL